MHSAIPASRARLAYRHVHVHVHETPTVRISRQWPLPPRPDYGLCSRRQSGRPSQGATVARQAAQPALVILYICPGSPRRNYFRRCIAVDRTLRRRFSPGCASSAPAGSMGFTNKQKENSEASAVLTHAVLDHELFKRFFEQVAISRISGKRPFVEVYATCTGSCKMTAEDRWKHPGRSTRSARSSTRW